MRGASPVCSRRNNPTDVAGPTWNASRSSDAAGEESASRA